MISDNDNDKSQIDLRDRIMKGDGDGEIDLKRGQWRERNEFSRESQVSFCTHGHFLSTQVLPPSSYSCFEIHI